MAENKHNYTRAQLQEFWRQEQAAKKRKSNITPEAQMQIQAGKMMDQMGLCWVHIPNERQWKSVKQVQFAKRMGLKPGAVDIHIFTRPRKRKPWHVEGCTYHDLALPSGQWPRGVAIELKHGRNRLTQNQELWLDALHRCQWLTYVARSIEDVQAILLKLY